MQKGTFYCIDAHTCGNPVRLVTSGHPALVGNTMGERRQDFLTHHDWIRQSLMFEPRGHDMMSGAFLYPPIKAENDAAILFIETSGCLPMCGHGTIGTITAGLEAGLIQPKTPGKLNIEVPAGDIVVDYHMANKKVEWVKIYNIASYLAHQNIRLEVPGLGELFVDVAYGGNFYIIVEPQDNFPGIEHWRAEDVLRFSPLVRDLVNQQVDCIHPEDSSVSGASHLLWTGTPKDKSADAANAVFYGDKAIDRSPCGTGTSARMAQLFAKGQLTVGQEFIHESFIGSQFVGCVEQVCQLGEYTAIMPSIKGWAKVFGSNCITVDTDDPYHAGFQVV